MNRKTGTAGVHPAAELLSAVHADLRDPPTLEQVAAGWSDALLEHGDNPELRRDFECWYEADPEHAAAFDRVDAAYRSLREASGANKLWALENDTMARITARARETRHKRYRRRAAIGLAASLAVVMIAGVAVIGGDWRELRYLPERIQYALSGDTLYRTDVGERFTATLDDGTVLTLNTNSRAVVHFAAQNPENTRAVTLLQGQALFEVARDETRPFRVRAGGRTITALGTAFDVRVTGGNLEVTLIEGKVRVEEDEGPGPRAQGPGRDEKRPAPGARRPADSSDASNEALPLPLGGEGQGEGGSSRTTILRPGEQLIVATASQTAPIIRKTDIRRITSWRQGQVLFEDEPLRHALQEINRYNKRRVVLADENLANLRVSGAFNANKTEVFVEMLTKYFPIRIVETDEDHIVLGHKSPGA